MWFHNEEIASRNMRLSKDQDPQWDRVHREAARAGAPYKSELKGLVEYVKQLSGGLKSPVLLNDLQSFLRLLDHQRTVDGLMYDAVAKLQIDGEGSL